VLRISALKPPSAVLMLEVWVVFNSRNTAVFSLTGSILSFFVKSVKGNTGIFYGGLYLLFEDLGDHKEGNSDNQQRYTYD
jgi:hypothetical protein